MNRFIWLVIFCVAVIIQAKSTSLAYAFGGLIVWFIVGVALSPIWWGITKERRRATPWQWFDWLNVGAYIMIGLQVLSIMVRSVMQEKFGG